MTVTLCVMLWPVAGREPDLERYEDTVLALLSEHSGRVVVRARASAGHERGDGPYETQVIEFDSPDGLASYLADARRTALAGERDAAIMRTAMQHVDLV